MKKRSIYLESFFERSIVYLHSGKYSMVNYSNKNAFSMLIMSTDLTCNRFTITNSKDKNSQNIKKFTNLSIGVTGELTYRII